MIGDKRAGCRATPGGTLRATGPLLAATLCLLVLFFSIAPAEADEVVVGVHASAQKNGTLTRGALQAIFAMRLRAWPDGSPIKVFVLPDAHPVHIAFCKQMLHVFPHQMRRAWDRLVYSGTGQAPIEVDSEEEMRTKLAATPGAIGYLRQTMVDATVTVMPVE